MLNLYTWMLYLIQVHACMAIGIGMIDSLANLQICNENKIMVNVNVIFLLHACMALAGFDSSVHLQQPENMQCA